MTRAWPPGNHRRRAGPLLGLSGRGVFLLALAFGLSLFKLQAAGQFPGEGQATVSPRGVGPAGALHTPAAAETPVLRQLQEHVQGEVDANGEPDCGDNAAFASLSAQVMHSCCPAPAQGEEETGSDECELPATCDSTGCADRFLEFFDACNTHLSALSAALFRRFDEFNAGCEVRTPR